MRFFSSLGLIVFTLSLTLNPVISFAGQGRDGGWPQSIKLLSIAKRNLLDLIAQATDQDIKDAMNDMHDRDASFRPEEINVWMLKYLVSRVQDLDVLDIEKSKYSGVRLFDYSDEHTRSPKVFVTKNFYNSDRYGRPINEVSVSLIKEVQTLILHEVSHLWGFGEETPETNYAEKFAVKMVAILHGEDKVSFTPAERFKLIANAYKLETHNPISRRSEKNFNGFEFYCQKITQDSVGTHNFKFELKDYVELSSEGFELVADRSSVGRATTDDYLIFRNSESFDVCHKSIEKVSEIEMRFLKRYYS